VSENSLIKLNQEEKYVSRAGLKLASVANSLGVDFKNKLVLDVGSSTGGFTDYALKHGAKKVVAVDVGTEQLHPKLRQDLRVELHEKTDVRNLQLTAKPDIILVDVSFISLREVLPSISKLSKYSTQIIAMVKPQFEAGKTDINRGIVKNDSLRRKILKDFETWAKDSFLVVGKADSQVAGAKGNLERFYHLRVATARRGR
jgi:23S rRNA (cytidine1920-2'-O)/16S rRNA (cytidine1409-2'-O)-methyltransferase